MVQSWFCFFAVVGSSRTASSALIIPQAARSKEQLFGITTNNNGGAGFASIDATTGAATMLFTFALPNNATYVQFLAYHPGAKHFYATLFGGSPYHGMIKINPVTRVVTWIAPGVGYAEGIEYLPSAGSLVLSFSGGSTLTTNLARIAPDGTILGTNAIPVIDADSLGIDPLTGALVTFDGNNRTERYALNRIDNATTNPIRTGLYDGSVMSQVDNDVARMGEFLYLDRSTLLCRFASDYSSIQPIGPYGLQNGHVMMGIAAAPRMILTAPPRTGG